jgi:hypothetical protein
LNSLIVEAPLVAALTLSSLLARSTSKRGVYFFFFLNVVLGRFARQHLWITTILGLPRFLVKKIKHLIDGRAQNLTLYQLSCTNKEIEPKYGGVFGAITNKPPKTAVARVGFG